MSILNLKAWIGQQCNLKYEENNSDAHLSNKKNKQYKAQGISGIYAKCL